LPLDRAALRSDQHARITRSFAQSIFFSLGLNHPSEKKMLKIKDLEHVLIGKVDQLFRNML